MTQKERLSLSPSFSCTRPITCFRIITALVVLLKILHAVSASSTTDNIPAAKFIYVHSLHDANATSTLYVSQHGRIFVWHALSAGAAWAVLAPFAAAGARLARITGLIEADAIFRLHRFVMLGASILTAQTWIVGMAAGKSPPLAHSILGTLLLLAAVIQTFAGMFRPPAVVQDDTWVLDPDLDESHFASRHQDVEGVEDRLCTEESCETAEPICHAAYLIHLRAMWARFHATFGIFLMVFAEWVLWHSLGMFRLGQHWYILLGTLIGVSLAAFVVAELIRIFEIGSRTK